MKTAFLLMAQYNAQAVIPVAKVVEDYFPHLTTETFVRKVSMGHIDIPLIRIEPKSQKSAKGVHVDDLADYLDGRRAAAVKEANQLNGR
ncbi:MAG: Pyocin activator protein PrtN [Verrucomicrobiaceae bacterium]|nr:MAG: Pyocin activator protein PrtN [Verrucomicrobiaceae bacterium]